MKLLACFIMALFLLAATDVRAGAPTESAYRWPAELVAGNNQFAIDLYRQLSANDGPLFFSPFSISTALAMTYAGASGDTAAEMAKTLHFTLPANRLHADYAVALKQLVAAAPAHGYQCRIANRLWGQDGYKFLDSFLQITRKGYGAALAQLDFQHQGEQARSTINAWVAGHTANKIKNLIPAGLLQSDTRLVLTNAIYFKGDWQLPFDKNATQKTPFHLTAQTSADVPMMYQQKHLHFTRIDDALLLELPYKGGDLSMVVMLPDKVDGLPALEKTFTADNYAKWIAQLRGETVRVWLPKFQTTEELQLADSLAAMGMPSAFSATSADFSGMDGKRDLFISKVLHKAYVDVDEKGTEAAAATGTVMRAGAIFRPEKQEEFKADHPFLFLLRDMRSGIILFMGRYLGPQ